MKQTLLNIYNRYFKHKAVVLMYHRIAEPTADVWRIAVSCASFEEQLQVLKEAGNVVPLAQIVGELQSGKLKKNHIAITFDDGYADNYTIAKPLLEKYQLPATFFIASGTIGTNENFWWDELEYIFLFAKILPESFR